MANRSKALRKTAPAVGIIMGSQSDWATMQAAAHMLDALKIGHETRIVSAHRTPDRMAVYAKEAEERGLKVIIAGAGGAAHLPGGVPVATFAIGEAGAKNAALHAAAILGLSDLGIKRRLDAWRDKQTRS